MAESALYKSYRATEKAKAERALDEALGRLEAAEPQQPTPPIATGSVTAPASQEPKPGIFESIKRGFKGVADTLLPPNPAVGQDTPGVLGSVVRGLRAIPDRFYEGLQSGKQVADAIVPPVPDDQRTLGERAKDAGLGLVGTLNVVFPFSAFAGETGGDGVAWFTRATGELTNERLMMRLEDARNRPPAVPEMGEFDAVPVIERLLAVPEAQRLQGVKELGGIFSEVLTGTIPGYTTPSR